MPTNSIRKAPQRERIYPFTAQESGALLELLFALLPELSRTTVKQYLRNRCVVLRGETTTQFDAPVATGDTIEIYNVGAAEALQHPLNASSQEGRSERKDLLAQSSRPRHRGYHHRSA